jgi:hypothetical protein
MGQELGQGIHGLILRESLKQPDLDETDTLPLAGKSAVSFLG